MYVGSQELATEKTNVWRKPRKCVCPMGFLNNLLAGKGMVDYRFVSTHGMTILHGSREREWEFNEWKIYEWIDFQCGSE